MLQAQLKQWGNSFGIRISKKEAAQLQLAPGDRVTVVIQRPSASGFGMLKGVGKTRKPFVREADDPHRTF
jgi:hypothetical protein